MESPSDSTLGDAAEEKDDSRTTKDLEASNSSNLIQNALGWPRGSGLV